MHASGASRREIANVCLESFLLFEDFEIGVCAKRYLTSHHKTHPSCPDLIRASVNLVTIFFEEDGSPGQAR
jgi:hypothetical protein